MDTNTLAYMQNKVKRGEALQAAIRELKADVKLLERFHGIKIIAVSVSTGTNNRPIFTVLPETELGDRIKPAIISEINKTISELEAEFAAL